MYTTKTKRLFFVFSLGITIFSYAQKSVSTSLLVDKKATFETQRLYKNLQALTPKGILFGHQDDLAYGVKWRYEEGRSDVKDVTNDYPAVYGWDLAGLEKKSDKNIDGVPFDKMKQYIIEGHSRGGVITISWHCDNPLTGGPVSDTTPNSLAAALPNGTSHEKYKSWLDEIATFFNTLKDKKGKPIPVLFRPFHELNGSWFWWGKNNATSEDLIALWRFTFDYLQSKGVHNLIYLYNTDRFKTREEYLASYPGADYVDMLTFDTYHSYPPTAEAFIENCQRQLKIVTTIAKEQNKITAFAETGFEAIPYDKWWTDTLMKAIGDYKISYVLLWRNQGWQEKEQKMHYYTPYKGHPSEKDFVDFYNLKQTLFGRDAAKAKLYK